MQKAILFFSFLGLMFAGLTALAQNNGNYPTDQNLIGKANAAWHNTCQSSSIHQGAVEGRVTTVSACFAGGFIKVVEITPKVNCNQVDCNLIRIALLARVTFGCDGEVISVECRI